MANHLRASQQPFEIVEQMNVQFINKLPKLWESRCSEPCAATVTFTEQLAPERKHTFSLGKVILHASISESDQGHTDMQHESFWFVEDWTRDIRSRWVSAQSLEMEKALRPPAFSLEVPCTQWWEVWCTSEEGLKSALTFACGGSEFCAHITHREWEGSS